MSSAPKKIRLQLLEKKEASKSRVASRLASELKLNRKSVLTTRRKNIQKRQQYNRQKAGVVRFLKKPANSTTLPGKRDVTGKGQTKYTLNDTMSNLYRKYKSEHPNSKISLATFCRQRPSYMKCIQWADRRQCLCVQHQNGRLKLKAIHINTGISQFFQEKSPEQISQMLLELPDTPVKFREWQKQDIEYQGGIIKKFKLKEIELSKEDFTERFEDEFSELREHVVRMKNQYEHLDLVKKYLSPLTRVTCQMDYSENFACSYQDEPAQAFYDRSMVTVHPMVVHYVNQENKLEHKSFVGISEEKSHSAATTFAFIKKLVPKIVELLPTLEHIHYVTDSPVSQYRNKSVCKIIAQHPHYFNGITSSWDYLEKGHGKGPCDGVGGSIKKFAETAVKKGVIIGNATDFFNWAERNNEKMTCILVTPGEVSVAQRMLNNAESVKGLSKCHTIRAFQGYLHIRDRSCYKECCKDNPQCDGWVKTKIKVSEISDEESENASDNDAPTENVPNYQIGAVVDAYYSNKEYRGEIINFSEEDQEYEIKFMKKNRAGVYIWPKSTWSSWIHVSNIIRAVE